MQTGMLSETLSATYEEKMLPAGWRWERLRAVCYAVRGVTFSSDEAKAIPFENSIACLTTSGVQNVVTWDSRCYIPRQRIKASEQFLRESDLLVSTANSKALVGKSCLVNDVPFDCTFGAFVTVLRARENIEPYYLANWLRTSNAKMYCYNKSSNTTNISNLRIEDLLDLEIPLPPTIEEQRRIASILDAQMKAVEQARSAVEEQLGAANHLQNAFLRSVFESDESKQWKLETVGNISSLIIDGPHVTPYYVPHGVPFLTVRNIVNRRIDFSSTSFITEADHEEFKKRGKAERGDILYTKDGTLGIPCVVDTDREFSFFVSVALIKLIREIADPYFIAFALQSPAVLEQVKLLGAGAGLKHMVLRSIRSLKIPLPSTIKEQTKVAEKLTEQMQSVETLKKSLTEKFEAVKKLPAALLRKAFAGEL